MGGYHGEQFSEAKHLRQRLDARAYLVFIQAVLLEILNDVYAHGCRGMGFQDDVTPSHHARA